MKLLILGVYNYRSTLEVSVSRRIMESLYFVDLHGKREEISDIYLHLNNKEAILGYSNNIVFEKTIFWQKRL
jgi:hypothetical protein